MGIQTSTCPDPTCKVGFWTDVITKRTWHGRARNEHDARLALGSAELVCKVFHGKGTLCSCRYPVIGDSLVSSGCLVHDPTRAGEAARVRVRLIETTRRAGI